MRKLFLSFSFLALVLAFAACKKSSNSAPTTAQVMFVDGCAGTTSIDVSVGTSKLSGAAGIAFLKNTGYLPVTAGSDSIAFILSNLGTPLTKNSAVSLTAGANYSIYAGGLITSPLFLFVGDDLSTPTSGNAKIRFINLSADMLSETAYAGSASFAIGITSGVASAFAQVATGTYIIKAGDPSNISTVVSTPSMQIAAGRIYTVILTGTLTGSGTSGLTLTVINNN